MNYHEYLQSPEWARLRDAVLARDKTCVLCGYGIDLQVHHRTYERVGCELLEDLVALCLQCHRLFHAAVPIQKPATGKWRAEIEAYRPLNPKQTTEAVDELWKKLGWGGDKR